MNFKQFLNFNNNHLQMNKKKFFNINFNKYKTKCHKNFKNLKKIWKKQRKMHRLNFHSFSINFFKKLD